MSIVNTWWSVTEREVGTSFRGNAEWTGAEGLERWTAPNGVAFYRRMTHCAACGGYTVAAWRSDLDATTSRFSTCDC